MTNSGLKAWSAPDDILIVKKSLPSFRDEVIRARREGRPEPRRILIGGNIGLEERGRTNHIEMRNDKSMAIDLGYYLSGAIAVAITFIGARFFFARYAAAAAYGVAVEPDPRWEAYLSVKAIRDIAAGLFTATLMLYRPPGLLG